MNEQPVIGRVMEDDEGQYVVFSEGFTLDASAFKFRQAGETLILTPICAAPETIKSE